MSQARSTVKAGGKHTPFPLVSAWLIRRPWWWRRHVPPKRHSHVTTDDQSVSKSWTRAPCGSRDRTLISVWHLRVLFYRLRAPPWREVGSVICRSHYPSFKDYTALYPRGIVESRVFFAVCSVEVFSLGSDPGLYNWGLQLSVWNDGQTIWESCSKNSPKAHWRKRPA
jgi:hypothetical protein